MENKPDDKYHALSKVIKQLLNVIIGLVIFNFILLGFLLYLNPTINFGFKKKPEAATKQISVVSNNDNKYWKAPDISELNGNPDKEIIEYGRELIVNTAAYFGPGGKVKLNLSNGLNCQNCHLEGGTKVLGNNFGSVFSTYPKLRDRSGQIENLYKRVNDCFERSMNGSALDTTSKEMIAITAYINWLGKDVPKGTIAEGSKIKSLKILNRAADPVKGKQIYIEKCNSCHMPDGQGVLNADSSEYTYPPLWGEKSYNTGAGIYRLSSFAKFVKYNMPFGTSYKNMTLSDEEAWDVAAFVNSQPRTVKQVASDWPDLKNKPFDHPFGPYADGFSEEQHKYGPFEPIQKKLNELKGN